MLPAAGFEERDVKALDVVTGDYEGLDPEVLDDGIGVREPLEEVGEDALFVSVAEDAFFLGGFYSEANDSSLGWVEGCPRVVLEFREVRGFDVDADWVRS